MTDLELMNVRRLIAESTAKSAQRHSEFLGKIVDLQFLLIAYYQGQLPHDPLPHELRQRIDALTSELQP